MTTPLALVFYENILPGSQLVIRLQDLGYRVHSIGNAKELVEHAERERPLIVVVDLISQTISVSAAIQELKGNSGTNHIPVLAFVNEEHEDLRTAAASAGAALVVSDVAILNYLPQLLDQALHLE